MDIHIWISSCERATIWLPQINFHHRTSLNSFDPFDSSLRKSFPHPLKRQGGGFVLGSKYRCQASQILHQSSYWRVYYIISLFLLFIFWSCLSLSVFLHLQEKYSFFVFVFGWLSPLTLIHTIQASCVVRGHLVFFLKIKKSRFI